MSRTTYSLANIRAIAQSSFKEPFPADAWNITRHLLEQLGLGTSVVVPSGVNLDNMYVSSDLSLFAIVPETTSDRYPAERVCYASRPGGGGHKRSRMRESSAEDWEAIRTFQPTASTSSGVGFQSVIDNVRAQWNKTTDKTYIDSREKIFNLIRTGVEPNTTAEEKEKLAVTLYEIASNNQFYSRLYAELYAGLLTEFEWLRGPLETILRHYEKEVYGNFVYYSDDNYDQFCEMNKCNDRRRAQSCFLVHLGLVGFVPMVDIAHILRYLIQSVVDRMSLAEERAYVDEMTENIALMCVPQLFDVAKKHDSLMISLGDGEDPCPLSKAVRALAKCSPKIYPGLSNKTIFKYMDIVDARSKAKGKK